MSDLISRKKLLEQIKADSEGREGQYGDEWFFIDTINAMPTAESKAGKWERKPYKRQGHEEVVIEGYSWRCSNCGDARKRNEPDMNFCPNCGAKMERSE